MSWIETTMFKFGGVRTLKFDGGLFQLEIQNRIPQASANFQYHFWTKVKKVLTENAVGLAYDLARSSLPVKGTETPASAYAKFIQNHQIWTKTAFARPKDRLLKYWIVENDFKTVSAYVAENNFRFTDPWLDKALRAGNYAMLAKYFSAEMRTKGEVKPPRPQVYDDASLELLYKFKMGVLNGKSPKDKYYIRNTKSIEKVLNDRSFYNRVGLMAGGWQKAARDLGGKADANTKPFNEIWANGKGKGYGKIEQIHYQMVKVTINNSYGNIFNWAERPESQELVRKRVNIMDGIFRSIVDKTEL